MKRVPWTIPDVPSQEGRTAVITGGTSGLGLEMARVLLGNGARVVIASRSPAKGAATVDALRREQPDARVAFEPVDTGDLSSVRGLAERLRGSLPEVHLLINNAGIAYPPSRQLTPDAIEAQFETNYLGHFLLTAELWPLLARSDDARVVTMASVAHRRGRIAFDDINHEHQRYGIGRATYAQSKLAELMFAVELQRRIEKAGSRVKSVAAHPGLSATPLIAKGRETGRDPSRPRVGTRFLVLGYRLFSQSIADGALSPLFAATAPEVEGGGYYGPTGWMEFRGPVGIAKVRSHARDPAAATRLWTLSEALVGRPFTVTA